MPSLSLAPEVAAFYTAQSVFTDPGDLAPRYADLPAEPAQLARVARELMVHRLEAEQLGLPVPPGHLRDDAETRYLDEILRVILGRDGAPLPRPRRLADRFVGVCRDFALMLCSFLRHTGVPARLRVGFADYLGADGFHYDHVVTEYWEPGRGWLLADAQLCDPGGVMAGAAGFDPMDVPRDRFLVSGTAWRLVRAGEADPETFGLPGVGTGEWWLAESVRLDLATLNRAEVLQWDVWGPGPGPGRAMTGPLRELYDEAAALTGDDVPFAAARARFTGRDDMRPPRTVRSYTRAHGPVEVTLREPAG